MNHTLVLRSSALFSNFCIQVFSLLMYLMITGHHMAVYAVKWNPFHPRVFLSCSADWTVKVWDHNSPTPILSFDLGTVLYCTARYCTALNCA